MRIWLLLPLLAGCPSNPVFVVGDTDALGDGGAPLDALTLDAPSDVPFVPFDSGPPPPPTCEGLVEASATLELSCRDPAQVEPFERTNDFGEALAFGEGEFFVSATGFREGFAVGGVAVYGAEGEGHRLTQWLIRDGIGSSLALRGTRLLVGAAADSIDGEDRAGFVVEYERQDCGWVKKDLIDSPALGAARAEDRFGASIALHDDFAIIGSGRTEGAANVYYSMQYGADGWTLSDTLTCGTQATQQHQLHSLISADGQVVLLRNDEDAVLCTFRRSGTDALLWELVDTTALDGPVNFQGSNVSISDDLVFVGSSGLRYANPTIRAEAGAVRVFSLSTEGLTELPDLIIREPEPSARHEFGTAVHAECDSLTRECALWVASADGSEAADEAGVLWRVVWHRVDGVRSIERLPSCAVGPLGEIGRRAVFRGDEAFVSSPVYGRAWRVID